MKHTYLYEPGVWTGAGTFWREDGEPLPAECRTEIAHQDGCWLICGTLKVLGAPPVEFLNACTIEPPGRKGACLKWTSENATLGKLHGTYSVLEKSILSIYRCAPSGYHGAEHYCRIDDDTYQASGVLLLEERRLSSWELLLRRVTGGTGSLGCSDRSATPRTATSGS